MAHPSPGFRFGDFAWLCNRASLTVCPALGLGDPQCYSRNVGIDSLLIFQPCTQSHPLSSAGKSRSKLCVAAVLAVDVAALLMTTIMIVNIKNKYTAVGTKDLAQQ